MTRTVPRIQLLNFTMNLCKPKLQDWKDLWRPELAGKISMVDSPREVIGAVLKYMGASYNTLDFNSQVPGGRDAVLQNLLSLQKQVLVGTWKLFSASLCLSVYWCNFWE